MKKYAMIPINTKEDEEGNIHVRRVLISYRFKTHSKINKKSNYEKVVANYRGTKIIATDDYFKNPNATHRYTFYDNGYALESVHNNLNGFLYAFKPEIFYMRVYHGLDRKYDGYPSVIEFKANTKDEAIKLFTEREELL